MTILNAARRALALTACLTLAACGGQAGGPSSPPSGAPASAAASPQAAVDPLPVLAANHFVPDSTFACGEGCTSYSLHTNDTFAVIGVHASGTLSIDCFNTDVTANLDPVRAVLEALYPAPVVTTVMANASALAGLGSGTMDPVAVSGHRIEASARNHLVMISITPPAKS